MDSQEWSESPRRLRRRREAEALYRFEMMLHKMGFSDFVYDEEEDLFRFRDGRFAYSRHHAATKLLLERDHRARGSLGGPGYPHTRSPGPFPATDQSRFPRVS